MRNKGNHEHNKNILQSKEGELIFLRRPQGDGPVLVDNYSKCPHCYGWVSEIAKHVNCRCMFGKNQKATVFGSERLILHSATKASKLVREEVYPRGPMMKPRGLPREILILQNWEQMDEV